MNLRPVSFRYKQAAADGSHPEQYGLIAEEVAKVYPDLVQYDKQGKPFTVYYHLLTPMMLNELQKAHAAQKAQQAKLDLLQEQIDELKKLVGEKRISAPTQASGKSYGLFGLRFAAGFALFVCSGAGLPFGARRR